ncbi:MAG: hypothetical protein K5761_00370 [Clostridiales bacterium]|nr:hypothetical protein [Clostridiales bacterium]
MDDTIERIIKTDESVRTAISEKRHRLDYIQDEITAAQKEADKELSAELEKNLKKYEKESEKRLETEKAEIDEKYKNIEENLHNSFEESREKWVDELFERVLK